MNNYFALILTRYRKDQGFTQRELLEFLYQQTNLLSSLDLVTLSRWENGKTAPPMERRLLILLILGKCEEYFYLEAENKKDYNTNNLISKVLIKRFDKVSNLLTNFHYGSQNKNFSLNFYSYDNAPDVVKVYTSGRNAIYDQICHSLNAQIGCWKNDDYILGFFVHASINDSIFFPFYRHIDNIEEKIKFSLNKDLPDNALFVMDQISSISSGFELSNLRVFLTLLSNYEYKKIYMCTHIPTFLQLALRLGGEIVGTYTTNEMKCNNMEHSQLVVFDSLKFISNKSVFEFFANVYNKLNRNNPELLKQLRESIK
ncbi:TPA: hypothetical protein ACX6Q0_003780 [Photobacterium damselae]